MSAGSSVPVAEVAERHARLRERLDRAGGGEVEVVAVTKGFDRWAVDAALELGLRDIGENYAQELLAKAHIESSSAPVLVPRWHFIGRLQRNKVKKLAPLIHLWQSVDRTSLGLEIAARAPGGAVLVQINLSDEVQKGGCSFTEAPGLVEDLDEAGLDVRGLMGVGLAGEPEAARSAFRRLVALADELTLPVRSIGMSADLEVAVSEGATMVRVGSDLFGPRPTR